MRSCAAGRDGVECGHGRTTPARGRRRRSPNELGRASGRAAGAAGAGAGWLRGRVLRVAGGGQMVRGGDLVAVPGGDGGGGARGEIAGGATRGAVSRLHEGLDGAGGAGQFAVDLLPALGVRGGGAASARAAVRARGGAGLRGAVRGRRPVFPAGNRAVDLSVFHAVRFGDRLPDLSARGGEDGGLHPGAGAGVRCGVPDAGGDRVRGADGTGVGCGAATRAEIRVAGGVRGGGGMHAAGRGVADRLGASAIWIVRGWAAGVPGVERETGAGSLRRPSGHSAFPGEERPPGLRPGL